jgi:hypothetical protein
LIVSNFGSPGPAPIKYNLPVDVFAPFLVNATPETKNPPPAEPIVGFSNLYVSLKLVIEL